MESRETNLGWARGPMTETDSLLRAVLVVALAVLFIPVLLMMLAMPVMGVFGWTHMGTGGMWDGPVGWFVWLVMFAVPLLVLTGVGYVVYRLLGNSRVEETDTAMEELRRAYARGELSDEEFENRRERLQKRE